LLADSTYDPYHLLIEVPMGHGIRFCPSDAFQVRGRRKSPLVVLQAIKMVENHFDDAILISSHTLLARKKPFFSAMPFTGPEYIEGIGFLTGRSN